MPEKETSAEATVKNIRRSTRRKYSAEEKIRIVIEGLRGAKNRNQISMMTSSDFVVEQILNGVEILFQRTQSKSPQCNIIFFDS